MNMITRSALAFATLISAPSMASFDIKIDDDKTLTFGGYFKVDLRNVSGDIAYRDFWIGNNVSVPDTNETRIFARESRFNIKYQQSDVSGFLEWDFYDDQQPVGTTETVTGGHSLRLRHAFIQYGNWKVGQTWSTFMPLVSIAEALDFGGARVGQAFVRQGQIRYTYQDIELAIENPSTQSGEDQSIPDMIARYTLKDDWGQVAVAGLIRYLEDNNNNGGADGTQLSYNIHGKIIVLDTDDIRFSYNGGRPGRYVSYGANINDGAIDGDIYDVHAYTLAYRHEWAADLHSSIYYGGLIIDDIDADRQHIGINLIKNLTDQLSVGIEVGNYETETADSNYYQASAKFVL